VISGATYLDIRIVASTMRESDRREIYATRWAEDPGSVAANCNASLYKWTYRRPDGALVAAFGALELWPGVWSIWMFANDLWDAAVARDMIRFLLRVFRTEIPARGARRLECRSTADHHDAHRFIKALGLSPEGTLRAYGRGGEDFITFARVLKM
jgi:RimJ/RimL family protein N-acetyltransferase